MNSQQLSNSGRKGLTGFSAGFSLVELLLSLTLGLILIAGMLVVYASNVRSSALNNATSSMQENLRFGLSVLENGVRMAGYQGCISQGSGPVDIIALESPSLSLARTAISGAVVQPDGSWTPAPELGSGSSSFSPPDYITPRVGTHTLAVQFAKTPGSKLREVQKLSESINASAPLLLENTIDVVAGDLALVSTCDVGDIFSVTSTSTTSDGGMSLSHSASSNSSDSFQQAYGTDDQIDQTLVMPFVTQVFFVADSGKQRRDGTALYALYTQTMPFSETDNPATMLVEGVENMQLKFGISGTDGQLQYVSADDAAYDPTKIRSVRIGLLMSSYEAILDTPDDKTYLLSGSAISASSGSSSGSSSANSYANDRHFRIAANTTATVRNRSPE